MEHILQHRNRPLSLLLTPYRLTVVMLSIGFAVMTIVAGALNRPFDPLDNPFYAYVDIFPGEPESALNQRGFSCFTDIADVYGDPTEKSCQLSLISGDFFSIQSIVSDATIRRIEFLMREKPTVGDLALFLETHDFHWGARAATFEWQGKPGMAFMLGERRDFFRPVWKVTFVEMPLLD